MVNVLINNKYLKDYSPLPLNYNLDEIRNYIKIAEELHIKPLIGGVMYQQLLDEIAAGDIPEEDQTLLLELYRVEGTAVALEALPFIAFHFSEVGVTRGKSENSDSVDLKELNFLQQHLAAQLQLRKDHFIFWCHNYAGNYPYLVIPQCKVQPLKPLYKPQNPCKDIR